MQTPIAEASPALLENEAEAEIAVAARLPAIGTGPKGLAMEERELELGLRVAAALTGKFTPADAALIIERFKSYRAAVEVTHGELDALSRGLSQKFGLALRKFKAGESEAEIEASQKLGLRMMMLGDPDYPPLLARIPDPPVLLWIKGRVIELDHLAIAIVGSRGAEYYGAKVSHSLSADLAERGVTVISGLARGIDTAAHRGALDANGRTIAVVGSGLKQPYPPENKRLSEEIAERGAVLSELPHGTAAHPRNFPQRNRIISGLSLGVVVAQANLRSGSLITARMAAEQGREVFAVPGKIDVEDHRGTHKLIREGATLVETVDDVLAEIPALAMLAEAWSATSPAEQLGLFSPPAANGDVAAEGQVADAKPARRSSKSNGKQSVNRLRPKKPSESAALGRTPTETAILKQLKPSDPSNVEELLAGLGLPPHEVTVALLNLEMRGVIRQLPGRNFVLA